MARVYWRVCYRYTVRISEICFRVNTPDKRSKLLNWKKAKDFPMVQKKWCNFLTHL